MATKLGTDVIRLDFEDESGRPVLVIPENRDTFLTTIKQAAQACQMAYDLLEFREQFDMLTEHLYAWLREHGEKVRKAFLTVQDRSLLFLIVRNAVRDDEAFEEELTDLDLEIANDPKFDKVPLQVLALPACGEEAYGSFLMPGQTWAFKDAG